MSDRFLVTFGVSCVLVALFACLYMMFSFAAYADTQAMREMSRQRSIAKCDAKGHKGYYLDERGEVWCAM